jgi:inhibitor of KinA sporulation pathway (predicted exonuclease)
LPLARRPRRRHLGELGHVDAYQLQCDAQRHGLEDALAGLPPPRNFKKWWAKQMGVKRCGMGRAVAMAGLTWQGRQHRGIDDARNIARLLPIIEQCAST